MPDDGFRIDHDSLGDVQVPAHALYGAHTQRAVENFTVSGWRLPRPFIRALALIKRAAAGVNRESGRLRADLATAIEGAARDVEDGAYDEHFPVDVFQTGSGTSTNMNANEVIANLAGRSVPGVSPLDHVNMSQSSNDVIPSAIHISAAMEITGSLMPALDGLVSTITAKARSVDDVVITGRTHLMDALPLRLSQELSGWGHQIARDLDALRSSLPRLMELALGGTAVGTGLNAPPEFGTQVAARIADATGLPFVQGRNPFALISSQDTAVEVSGQLRTVAASLSKIAGDLCWMNSGPVAGLGEITLTPRQPGSSIMPGKVNPVIPEAVMMVCAQVVGNDATVTMAGHAGRFQLNTMLPLVAHSLLQSAHLLAGASVSLGDKAIRDFSVNETRLAELGERNVVLITALVPRLGYETCARIARKAYDERRPVKEVATELTSLTSVEIDAMLDLRRLTRGGVVG